MDNEDVIKIAWVVLGVVLATAEIAVPGFFLLPFGMGAGVGAIAAFLGAPFVVQLAAFVVASGLFTALLRPLAGRLNQLKEPEGVGANRLRGQPGIVIERIGADEPGLVRIDRESWTATSAEHLAIEVGAHVRVTEVRGTRVLVTTNPSPQRSPSEGSPP